MDMPAYPPGPLVAGIKIYLWRFVSWVFSAFRISPSFTTLKIVLDHQLQHTGRNRKIYRFLRIESPGQAVKKSACKGVLPLPQLPDYGLCGPDFHRTFRLSGRFPSSLRLLLSLYSEGRWPLPCSSDTA